MAITTQVQSSTAPGGAGPSGGGGRGPPGRGGGAPCGGGGTPGGGGGAPGGGGGGNPAQPAIGDRKPMGTLPTIYLKEITQKLRASENSPPISSLTMMSQHLPPSSKELPLPSHVLKDQK